MKFKRVLHVFGLASVAILWRRGRQLSMPIGAVGALNFLKLVDQSDSSSEFTPEQELFRRKARVFVRRVNTLSSIIAIAAVVKRRKRSMIAN